MKKTCGRVKLLYLFLFTFLFALISSPLLAEQKKYRLGDIPLPPEVYKKYQKVKPTDMALEMLEISYDARDEGIVTSAKNQGSCGSCWAFATVGAMESHLLKQYGVGPEDLSEQQQVSCNTAMYGCDGGNSNAIRYWENKGPVDEGYFGYTANDATACIEEAAAQLGYRVTDYHTVAATTAEFKNSLKTNGPSYWRYMVHDDFYTFWNNGVPGEVYVNTANSPVGGHAVLLIGWDDQKGAFLCKNSWGTGGPNGDGTFWIAYSGHANNLSFGMANFSLTSLSCSSNAECDDGVYCNGQEVCLNQTCQQGTPISCQSDNIFCNGEEVCSEATQSCMSAGDPCSTGESCDENNDMCVSLCGNGVCDQGENCSSCPGDCISGSSGGTCSSCFKGVCDGKCNPNKDSSDCSDCWSNYCCGDGVCEGDENGDNCAIDCPVSVCGDGTCDYDEDQCNCSADCGAPGIEICNNNLDDDCDGLVDCDDSDCTGDPVCAACKGFKESCSTNGECCSGKCKNGVCR